MAYHILVTSSFKRDVKRLQKRYKTFATDINRLIKELEIDPFLGTDLGNGIHKIRMAISAKRRGKSGGARVISYVDLLCESHANDVILLTVYDKSEQETISDKEIKFLLKEAGIE